jgi:hypothetical protein
MFETFFLWLAAAVAAVTRVAALRPGALSTAEVLFAAGWALGAMHPDGAWRRAVVLGLSVPLAQAVAAAAHVVLPYAPSSFAVACLAVIPASLGTWAGVAARRAWGDAVAPTGRRG